MGVRDTRKEAINLDFELLSNGEPNPIPTQSEIAHTSLTLGIDLATGSDATTCTQYRSVKD